MSVLQDISKQLLAVASMPPEKRNDALMEVKIGIESVQYDMVLEQKNLIMNIIDELIAENDAEQIAKSKLVFVPDVEEQIAPTKKTRAKKVTKPVASGDLPDVIAKFTSVKDLPESVKNLALFRGKEQNELVDLNDILARAFKWDDTPEGENFWKLINTDGDLREFKRKFGNKGEKVDEVIEFAELNEFVEGLSQQSAEAPAPVVKTRKPRTPKTPAPVVTKQEVNYVELIVYPPKGGVVNIKTESLYELLDISKFVINKLGMKMLRLNFNVITDLGTYTSQISISIDDSQDDFIRKLVEQYDTFVKPELNWKNFDERQGDIDLMDLNEKIVNDAFEVEVEKKPIFAPPSKPAKAVTPKPAKAVTPKPAKAVTPKPVKVVAPKVTKPKVTKPKVEDDLSFLNDLDNIF